MFTSGTTGKSKGVMLTQNNLAENATCLDMKIAPHTVILSVLPIHHAYCLSMDILKGISLGSVICINDSIMRMAKNIQLFAPDMILMVPLMIETFARKLEEVRAAGLPAEPVRKKIFGERLHTICSGGAYLNPDYVDLFAEFGITILQGYGMTECSPVISTNLSWDIRKNSADKPQDVAQITFVHANQMIIPCIIQPGHLPGGLAVAVDAMFCQLLPCRRIDRISDFPCTGGG